VSVEQLIADLQAARYAAADAGASAAESDVQRRLTRSRIVADMIREPNPATGKPWSATAADEAARTHTDYLAAEHAAVEAAHQRDILHADAESLRLRVDYALASLRAGN